ncbi:MAG: hypothetical protein ACKPH4_04375 [Microcystis panniformis]
MGKPQIAVRIPPPLLAELNQYIERVGTSKTDVIIENLGLKPRRSTTALLLNMSIVYEIYAKM